MVDTLQLCSHALHLEPEQADLMQDEGKMTHAAKLTKEEGILDFQQDALTLHNKANFQAVRPLTFLVQLPSLT